MGGTEVFVASIGTEHAPRGYWRPSPPAFLGAEISNAIVRIFALFTGDSDTSLVRRLAGALPLARGHAPLPCVA